METFKIKTSSSKDSIQNPHFFILNKGLNSGKPLHEKCPNCFVISFTSEDERDFYFWLLFGLWKTKSFHVYLRGSVIPFIVLRELKQAIIRGAEVAKQNPSDFRKAISLLKSLDEQEAISRKTLQLVSEARQAIFFKYLSK